VAILGLKDYSAQYLPQRQTKGTQALAGLSRHFFVSQRAAGFSNSLQISHYPREWNLACVCTHELPSLKHPTLACRATQAGRSRGRRSAILAFLQCQEGKAL